MAKRKDGALRRGIIAVCRQMNDLGINQGTSGNVSARLPDDPDRFLITPSGIPYEAMEPDQIVEMDLAGGYWGDYLPSSEWRMHRDIFLHRPEAGATVHTHPIYGTALSCLRLEIPAFHYMIGVGGGDTIRCADYATFGTQALSERMLKALADRSACLLANHGMICFGKNLDKALWLAVEVETLAKQYWHARQGGEPVILPKSEMKRVLALFQGYGKQPGDVRPGETLAFEPPERRDGGGRKAAKAAAKPVRQAKSVKPVKPAAKPARRGGAKVGRAAE